MKMIVIDCDYTYDKFNRPVIRLFGKRVDSEIEENVVVHVWGFEPYIYVDNCGLDIRELAERVDRECKGYIKRIEIVKKFRPVGYQRIKTDMLKLVLFNPRVVPELRKLLKEKIEEITDEFIYEADILFRDRFIIDMGIDGMSVIEFNEVGNELGNYGINCNNLYLIGMSDIHVCAGEGVIIDY